MHENRQKSLVKSNQKCCHFGIYFIFSKNHNELSKVAQYVKNCPIWTPWLRPQLDTTKCHITVNVILLDVILMNVGLANVFLLSAIVLLMLFY
jgi:hypothetical protein